MPVIITQSNYVPWRGWFAAARLATTLVLLDDVQFTRRDWRNRNLIRTAAGPKWITIPMHMSGHYHDKISEMKCRGSEWARSHFSSIDAAYRDLDGFQDIRKDLHSLYLSIKEDELLSAVNRRFIEWLFSILNIETKVRRSEEFQFLDDPSMRLLTVTKSIGATRYITAPAARAYLRTEIFDEASIPITWIDYEKLNSEQTRISGEPEYSILHTIATHGLDNAIRLSTFPVVSSKPF